MQRLVHLHNLLIYALALSTLAELLAHNGSYGAEEYGLYGRAGGSRTTGKLGVFRELK